MAATNTAKTRYEMTLEQQYGRIYNGLQARLFERIAATIDIIELLAGTSAFAAFLADRMTVGAVGAAAFALVPIVNKIVDPRGKALRAREQERRFVALLIEAPDLDDAQLARRIWSARGDDFIEGLRQPAFNRTLVEAGDGSPQHTLSFWQNLLLMAA